MHGPGPGFPPPRRQHGNQRSQVYRVVLRVIFAVLPLLTFGFLAWITMLRLAIVTRAGRDWALFALSAGLGVLGFVLVGTDPVPNAGGARSDVGMSIALTTAVATLAYFLYADLRRENRPPAADWYPPPHPPQAPYGYGYPPQAATPAPAPTQPPQAFQQPQQPPSPPRIGQVRAELDELSELLRRQEQGREPGQEPGR
ncbi:hypothetical protein ABT084_29685 [Streptomyces sp. NPDC002138]|uniref:hypothetical protein n=1 Tax=Streptomyces sp. NPDC002138 TaxID=3154410 RepID=UPI0033167E63